MFSNLIKLRMSHKYQTERINRVQNFKQLIINYLYPDHFIDPVKIILMRHPHLLPDFEHQIA